MITHITSISSHLVVNSYAPPWINNNGAMAGQMRMNTNGQNVEVYDGTTWHVISQTASVSLSPESEHILNWARQKMTEEKALRANMEKYPTLKSAYEQYKMVEALVSEEDKPNA